MNRRTDAMRWLCVAWAVVLLRCRMVLGRGIRLRRANPTRSRARATAVSLPSPKATLDSAISWTDQCFFHQWKIQQHVDTKQCRLLDEDGKSSRHGDF